MADSTQPISEVNGIQAVPDAVTKPHAPATPDVVPTVPTTDTVVLSEAAQVTLLQEQGVSAAQIAGALGLTVPEVNSSSETDVPAVEATTATQETR